MEIINIADFDYDLPDKRIAQYPADKRDSSKLLLYDGTSVSSDIFSNIGNYLPSGSLLVFNDTKVIRARLLFRKESGARIEIFCLEPLQPSDYEMAFSSLQPVEWKCIVGNLKKWKSGMISMVFVRNRKKYELKAENTGPEGDACRIRFSWEPEEISFGEVIESAGHIPLPPYIEREDETDDNIRYQTVYSKVKGSVAAPTAGLHFTEDMLRKIADKGIKKAVVTLHVGAGTFQPVRSSDIKSHLMHSEHIIVTNNTISDLIKDEGRIIAVGTTSVRTLESLYWLGVYALNNPECEAGNMHLDQWYPYSAASDTEMAESLTALLDLMKRSRLSVLRATTQLIIIPGYRFRVINGIITNFHQPRSTLLLLVAAWTGNAWKDIYSYALENGFRFLSYGDSSFLYNKSIKP